MKHVVLVGACFMDTILSVPHYPSEDDKLRATAVQVRRGGNCPNALEVLAQLLGGDDDGAAAAAAAQGTVLYLVAPLPAADAAATARIRASFPNRASAVAAVTVSLDHCLFRAGHAEPASCYIARSAATGSRTIVSHNGLPEMTVDEFAAVAAAVGKEDGDDDDDDDTWYHFEGRVPATTRACAQLLRRRRVQRLQKQQQHAQSRQVLSVEVENPAREGLRALAAEADVVFYSRTWAEHHGYASAEACLRGEAPGLQHGKLAFCTWGGQGAAAAVLAPSGVRVFACPTPALAPGGRVVDTVGAGDTFTAGVLYRLAHCQKPPLTVDAAFAVTAATVDADVQQTLAFAVGLATRKVQQDGLQGLITPPRIPREEEQRFAA